MNNNDEPIIHMVDSMLLKALENQVSDIHIETYDTFCRIRFRHNSLLHEAMNLPIDTAPRIIARVKILAGMDIAEKRLPQDGRFKITLQNKHSIDIRASSCPSLFGEKMVLRLLNTETKLKSLEELDFTIEQLKLFKNKLDRPQGLILVTGPTGSGKTTTLYSALNYLNHVSKNISTVEDPIEINLPSVNQVNINLKAEINFSVILRTFLRQDPDVIMVGEIRDSETAQMAIKAAQTGHLVLSSLHTNNAFQSITRLKNMGIAPYNLASSLTLITAQRLLRRLCKNCRQEHVLSDQLKRELQINPEITVYKAGKCSACHDGYLNRFAIHELLPVDEEHYDSLKKDDDDSLETAAKKAFFSGETSLDEIQRVIPIL